MDCPGPRSGGCATARARALTAGRLATHLAGLDRRLSRTAATGIADRTASPAKQPSRLEGPALRRRIDANRQLVARFIAWRRGAWPRGAGEHFGVLCTLGHLAGLGIFPAGLFREWEYDVGRYGVADAGPPVPPAGVEPALLALAGELARGRELAAAARVELVARAEWALGIGPLHPFYDGCGRISRYAATLLALWLDVPLVTHPSRDAYFRAARAGPRAFVAYYRERVRIARPRTTEAPAP
jgi:hypothetical protein